MKTTRKDPIKLYSEILDIPKYPDLNNPDTALPEFWRIMDGDELKRACMFFILGELRRHDSTAMSGEQCRAVLAKCQGVTMLMDFPNAYAERMNTDPLTEEDHQLRELRETENE